MKHIKVKSPTREELASLLSSVGGEAKLFAILHDFYSRMAKDAMVGFFFANHDLAHISKMQGMFILSAAGLTSSFTGRGPSTAHTALPPILSGHFDRRLMILRETLSSHSLNESEIETWLRFEESFRAIVVSD
jgi:truncated hemoglobin YjbI